MLGIILLVIFIPAVQSHQVFALQQVAGKIEVSVEPGESSSFEWGLLSDSSKETEILLRAEGGGSEFLSHPDSVVLEPGNLLWVRVNVSVPNDYPGSVEFEPSLFATELGEQGGATVMNIQMQKIVKLTILPNPDPSLANEPSVLLEYPQLVRIGGAEIHMRVQSSSTISNFRFDEGTKSVAFQIAEGSKGPTVVHIGSVLRGPYGVTIDDQGVAYESVESENGEDSISIGHDGKAHSISITGTSVVPEFPIPILMGAVALTAMIAALAWKRRAEIARY